MRYDHSAEANRTEASALLRDMRRRLMPLRDRPPESAEARHWTLSKVSGVHVYATPEGWHCDLAFEGMPPGMGNVVGTVEALPSREEALISGTVMLSKCAQRERGPERYDDATIVMFRFDGCGIPVHKTMVADYAKRMKGSTVDSIQAWLAELRYGIAGENALHPSDYGRIDDEMRREMIRACTAAAAMGMEEFTLEDAVWIPGPRM